MNPHHYAIRFGAGHDYHGFFAEEIGVREALGFPPFSRLIEVLAEAAEDAAARAMAEACAASLRDLVAREEIREVQVLGPTPALIHRLRGRHRWVVGLRGEDLEAIKPWLPDGRGFSVDVDPI
jgi:primosomal protein N' (replication factor Y)